jgi:hypothetical protein
VLSQLSVLIVPLAIAFAAVIGVTYLTNLNGVCGQCGEDLPRRGIVRCPWCRRLCFVLRFR